eukprot:4431329-Amphidinium_carterae.1
MGRLLEAEYEVKMTGCVRLGRVEAATAASQELVYLNRVIRAVPETQSMEIEADQRHVNMVLRELGLDTSNCKGKDLANVKLTAQELEEIEKTPVLLGDRAKQYRSLAMRIAYLSQDRVDLLESVRHMASRMKDPREGDW